MPSGLRSRTYYSWNCQRYTRTTFTQCGCLCQRSIPDDYTDQCWGLLFPQGTGRSYFGFLLFRIPRGNLPIRGFRHLKCNYGEHTSKCAVLLPHSRAYRGSYQCTWTFIHLWGEQAPLGSRWCNPRWWSRTLTRCALLLRCQATHCLGTRRPLLRRYRLLQGAQGCFRYLYLWPACRGRSGGSYHSQGN